MFAGSGSGCGSGADPATVASQPDASDFHSFSKTKVRGAVTLLKFAQVREREREKRSVYLVLPCVHVDYILFIGHHTRNKVKASTVGERGVYRVLHCTVYV